MSLAVLYVIGAACLTLALCRAGGRDDRARRSDQMVAFDLARKSARGDE